MANLKFGSNNKALSLLEVMVATAILISGVAVVAKSFSHCAHAAAICSDTLRAVLLAENKMQELELKEKAGIIAFEPKQIRDSQGKFDLECDIAGSAESKLYTLDMRLSWERLNERRSFALTTYLR